MALKLGDVRNVIRLNTNWLLAKVLGPDVLTKAEKEELGDRLPEESLKLIEKSFVLGRLKSLLTKSEFGKVDYEELVKEANKVKLTPVEKKVIEQLKHKASVSLKTFADKVGETVYQKIQDADASVAADAAIRGINDQAELDALEKKAYDEVVASLATQLSDVYTSGWNLTSETEFHAAKTQGTAQAILTGTGIYSGGGGPDARVSVIPKPTACEDCKIQYLGADGNPKIFTLSELIANGSNVDAKHSKTKGVHIYWKATLPPLHPRCRCDLQYIPDGASWHNGVLVISSLEKSISPVKKPQGAPANAAAPADQKPPTMTGIKSPLQGGNNKSTQAIPTPAAGGGKNEATVPCPFGGGDACVKAGGSGAETHKEGGASMQAHAEYKNTHRQGSNDLAESMATTQKKVASSQSIANPHAEALKKLALGDVISAKTLNPEEKGVTESYKCEIEGLGTALVKPPAYSNPAQYAIAQGFVPAAGAHTTPAGTGHKREKAFYQGAVMFGFTDHVPPTEVRSFNGQEASAQQWLEGYSPVSATLNALNEYGNTAKFLLESAPDDKAEKLRNKLHESIIMTALFNHGDQHGFNVMVKDDFSDIKLIDNTCSFGTGMEGFCCEMFESMHKGGYKVKIPQHVQDRFNKTTLSDLKRGLGGTLEDWAIGQTFLRMKYMMYLQEREGNLDYHKFNNATFGNGLGNRILPHPGFWDDAKQGSNGDWQSDEYDRRKAAGLTANQMFESFSKQWLIESATLPDGHPDRIAADELNKIGVFMGMGFAHDADAYRSNGEHRKYEESIKPGYPPANIAVATGIISPSESKKLQDIAKFSQRKTMVSEDGKPLELDLTDLDNEEKTKQAAKDLKDTTSLDLEFDEAFNKLTSNASPQKKQSMVDEVDEIFDRLITKSQRRNPRLFVRL